MLQRGTTALRSQIVMAQVPQRAILNRIFKALNLIHTERDNITTGGKFPVIPMRKPIKVKLEQGK